MPTALFPTARFHLTQRLRTAKRLHVAALALLLVLVAGAAAAGAAPDLVVQAVVADRVVAQAGTQIAVSADVVNTGALTAEPSRLKYYFSADATYDASDTYLNYDAVPALDAGAASPEIANVRIPAGTADGDYYVLVIADFDGDVAESFESNNTYALPVSVGGADADLVPEDVSLSANQALPNEVVSASCIVRNTGTEATVESRLKYYLSTDTVYDASDRYLNYDAVAPLSGDATSAETANLRIPADTAHGAYFILFVVDQTAVVAESDETNNVTALAIGVGTTPHNALEAVSIPNPLVRAGETLDVSATVRNTGGAPADAGRLVYFLSADETHDESDKQLSFDKIDPLAPGEASPEDAPLRVSAATTASSYFVLFVLYADEAQSAVLETVAVAVTVTGDDPDAIEADLVLVNAQLAATVVAAGEQVAASVTVENRGVVAAGESRLKYYLSNDTTFDESDDYLNYDNVSALAVGAASPESANLRVPSSVADGAYFILFVADETRAVSERYESNNVVALPVTVGEPQDDPIDDPDAEAADLMVTSAAVANAAVRAGDRASLSCRVENVGDFAASQASRVKYYLSRDAQFDEDDDYVGYDNVPALTPGEGSDESATPRIPELTSHGRWYLLVVADAADEVEETFESNNVASIAIDVEVDQPELDAPDLVASSPSAPSAVGAGNKLTLTVAVDNAGTQPAAESRLKLYLSGDTTHDPADTYLAYRDVAPLAEQDGDTITLDARIPLSAAHGGQHLLVVLDTGRALTERYESNNVLAIAITVGEHVPPSYPYACPANVFTDASLLPKHTIASLNALHLGHDNGKDMLALACIVSHFDLVGLVEVEDPAGVTELEAEVEALTGESWSSHVSATAVGNANGVEYYAYVWRTAEVTMTASAGFYDDADDLIKREPYGASFRMGAFDFTFVVFHLQYGNTLATRRFEASQLSAVYDYFQALDPNENDVLIGGDFNLPGDDAAFSIVGHDGVRYITDPEQKTTLGYDGPANSFDNVFFSATHTTELSGSGAHDYTMGDYESALEDVTDHFPVWIEVDTSVDDD